MSALRQSFSLHKREAVGVIVRGAVRLIAWAPVESEILARSSFADA